MFGGAPLLSLRRQRRQPAVRRIGNQRRPPIVPVAFDHPELVVVAGSRVVRIRFRDAIQDGDDEPVAELRVAVVLDDLLGEPLELRDLGIGEMRLALPLLGTLERRDRVVRPDALKVRTSVRRPRRDPAFRRARLRGEVGAARRGETGGDQNARRNDPRCRQGLGHRRSQRVSIRSIRSSGARRRAQRPIAETPRRRFISSSSFVIRCAGHSTRRAVIVQQLVRDRTRHYRRQFPPRRIRRQFLRTTAARSPGR